MCVISCAKHETSLKVSLYFEVAVRQEFRPVSKTCVSMVLIDVYKEPIDSHGSHCLYRGQFVRLLHETLYSRTNYSRKCFNIESKLFDMPHISHDEYILCTIDLAIVVYW